MQIVTKKYILGVEPMITEIEFWNWFLEFGIKPNSDIKFTERCDIFNERAKEFNGRVMQS